MMPMRCGRLDRHDEHTWTRHRHYAGYEPELIPAREYACNGHVVTTLAEQQWADRADFDEKADDTELGHWMHGWTA